MRWGCDLALGLGFGLAASWGFGLAVALGCGPVVGLGCGLAWGFGVAVGLGFGWAVGAGFAGVLVPGFAGCVPWGCGGLGCGAGSGGRSDFLGSNGRRCQRLGGVVGDLGCEVLDEEVVVAAEVGESGCEVPVEEVEEAEEVDGEDEEADEENVGGAGVGFCSGAVVWSLWAMRVRVRVRASSVRVRFPLRRGPCRVWCAVVSWGCHGLWACELCLGGGGGGMLLQGLWVCLMEVVDGAEEGPLDSRHVVLRLVGVVLGGGVVGPEQLQEAGRHHERAELQGRRGLGGGTPEVQGGLPLLGAEGDPAVIGGGGTATTAGSICKAVHGPAKDMAAAADGEQRL